MSKLKLISHTLCPYVQKAAIVLKENGIEYTRENIDLENPPGWFLEISPQGKVPVLVVDDRHVIFESSVICEYLDEVSTSSLHDDDPVVKAKHRAWVEFSSAILVDVWSYYTAKDEESFNRQSEQIVKKLHKLETEFNENHGDNRYFNGDRYSMVDVAFAPLFRYFDVFEKYTQDNIFNDLDMLAKWRKALKKRHSTQQVVSKNYENELIDFVIKKDSYLGNLMRDSKTGYSLPAAG